MTGQHVVLSAVYDETADLEHRKHKREANVEGDQRKGSPVHLINFPTPKIGPSRVRSHGSVRDHGRHYATALIRQNLYHT